MWNCFVSSVLSVLRIMIVVLKVWKEVEGWGGEEV